MPPIQQRLEEASKLVGKSQPAQAEALLIDLFDNTQENDLRLHAAEIRAVIDRFLPKRRRHLHEDLERRIGPPRPISPSQLCKFRETLNSQLANLSEHHIFQWPTFYRDCILDTTKTALELAHRSTEPQIVTEAIIIELSAHSREIYSKGFSYVTTHGTPDQVAWHRCLSGLQNFLELPVAAYSDLLPGARGLDRSRTLRLICSSMLVGILSGVAKCRLGQITGNALLASYPRAWAHCIAFMDAPSLERVVDVLGFGELSDGLRRSVVPVLAALDQLIFAVHSEYLPLPTLGQFIYESRRLDISIPLRSAGSKKAYLEISAFTNPALAGKREFEEMARRSTDLVAGAIRPDVRDWVMGNDVLRSCTLDTSAMTPESTAEYVLRARDILHFQLSPHLSSNAATTPLTWNFPHDFPLTNPYVAQYFRVNRKSVQELLSAYETRNGLRLWCSVRRSGKTTACTDLASATGAAIVLNQTCESTEKDRTTSIFYSLFDDALRTGHSVPDTFVRDAVAGCLDNRYDDSDRVVFVLDEYETLFERMQLAARRDREIRYTVVQPILNQLVAFSRTNLIVFIGQRPDAHYIIMDQNQLSPYVEQDVFPLFPHSTGSIRSEFRDLVRKVLSDRVAFDDGFVDDLYQETAGHPYLTVNVLTDMFDWLIAQSFPSSLPLTADQLSEYSTVRLCDDELLRSGRFDFFKRVIAEALAPATKDDMPWLHFVYSTMRRICQSNPETLQCPLSEFRDHLHDLGAAEYGYDEHELLRTATMANFFVTDGESVAPRIKTMGRLSRLVRPRLRA